MAQWKETLEPYVKVIESVKTAALNPTAGGDLILGAVIISDCGPSEPTLITSQSEFLEVYAAEDLTKDYIKSLDSLYESDPGSSLASTMWLNAYRLSGSASMLICRAGKGDGIIYTKPLDSNDLNDYIVKDSEILKRVTPFKFVIDRTGSENDGWAIALSDSGILGNLVDDNGPRYDYFVSNLVELVDKLNETDKFYSPKYSFYEDEKCEIKTDIPEKAIAVLFDEVYLGPNLLDTSALLDDTHSEDLIDYSNGLAYLFAAEKDWTWESTEGQENPQNLYDLNSPAFSGFDPIENYVSNLYNTRSNLSVRIRRFNHNAVTSLSTDDPTKSPWNVQEDALSCFIEDQSNYGKEATSLKYDFYEFLIEDPTISDEPVIFNVGNLPGRGDVTIEELKSSLGMMYLNLPEDLNDLGLGYYGYTKSDMEWVKIDTVSNPTPSQDGSSIIYGDEADKVEVLVYASETNLPSVDDGNVVVDTLAAVSSSDDNYIIYQLQKITNVNEVSVDVSLGSVETALLNVTDSDILRAWDKIEDEERYVVEGFSDLGNTYSMIQSYVANIAINSNYFYAFSTPNTTNYMTIANRSSKIGKSSHKLYAATPWDYDDGTVGFQFAVSPSVLYWETVMRNRQNNNEFAGVFGQNTGRVSVMNLAKEFKKTERQLLLSKKINTISYDNYLGSYYFNDNYTYTEESHVMSEECNSRLQIRISKAMPLLLNQFKGRQNTSKTWKEMREVIKFWFTNTIMNYNYTIAEYRIICDETNNTSETIRQNKVFVTIQVRFNSSIKFITVYNDAYPIGVEFSE